MSSKKKTKTEYLQDFFRRYQQETGKSPVPLRRVAAWMIDNDLYESKPFDLIGQCARDLRTALRQEFILGENGHHIRKWHHARLSEDMLMDGVEQLELDRWADIEIAEPPFMHIAFQQRRRGIVGDCKQLKVDMDWWNARHEPIEQLEFSFNIDQDLRELEQPDYYDGMDGSPSIITDDDSTKSQRVPLREYASTHS